MHTKNSQKKKEKSVAPLFSATLLTIIKKMQKKKGEGSI